MAKYPWADNAHKLQRAIAKANQELAPDREKRIKELYVSFGGKMKEVELPEDNQNKNMSELEDEKVEEVVTPETGAETSAPDVASEKTSGSVNESAESAPISDTEISDVSKDVE